MQLKGAIWKRILFFPVMLKIATHWTLAVAEHKYLLPDGYVMSQNR